MTEAHGAGTIVGILQTDGRKATMFDAFNSFSEQYPLLKTAIIIAVVLLCTWVVEHIVFKLIAYAGSDKKNPLPPCSIFANIARVCIWLIGISIALQVCFNVNITAIVAAIGVGGIAISLGCQDTLANLFGGLQISLGRIVEPGDYIEVLGQQGRVTDITWRHTTIIDVDNMEHVIPNSLINTNSLINIGDIIDIYTPFLIPLGTDIDAFTEAVRHNVDEKLADKFADDHHAIVQLSGTEEGGISGNVKTTVKRTAISPRVTRDTVMRAIDAELKAAGFQR